MSITREVTVWCDGKPDGEDCPRWVQASATARALRTDLRRGGWTRAGTQDFCPSCSAQRHSQDGSGSADGPSGAGDGPQSTKNEP